MRNFIPLCLRDKTLWVVTLLSLIILAPVLIEPLSFDSAIYQTLAIDMVHRGFIPYIQSFDQNFPGIVYLHCFEILLLGPSDLSLRLFDIALQLSFIIFLYRYLSKWMTSKTAALSSVLYALYYVSAGSGVYGQRDVYIFMATVVGFSLIFTTRTPWRIIFAGVVIGFTILIRPTSLLFLALASVFLMFDDDLKVRYLGEAVLIGIIGLLPMSLFLLYITQFPDGLKEFYDFAIRFNLDVYGRIADPSHRLWEILRSSFIIIFALVGALSSQSIPKERMLTRNQKLVYIISVVSFLLIVAVQGKFFRYHLAPFFMLLIPVAGMGIKSVTDMIRTPVKRHYAILACLALCSLVRFNPTSSLAFGLAILEHEPPFQRTYDAVYTDSLFGPREESAIKDYFRQQRNSEGIVEICSLDPTLRLHLNRKYASGFPTLHTLSTAARFNRIGLPVYTNYQLLWQRRYIDTLRTVKPRFIIIADGMNFWTVRNFNAFLHGLNGFYGLINESYFLDTTIGGYKIYQKNDH